MTFCIYLSKCLFGIFPKKTLRGRKSVQRGLCLKITAVTDADKRQASGLSPTLPPKLGKTRRALRESGRAFRTHYFLAFVTMSLIVFLLTFALIFCTNLSWVWGM